MKKNNISKMIFALSFCISSICATGVGRQVGNIYIYHDDNGDTYTVRSSGGVDFISGSNGYHGIGHSAGSSYFYNDYND